MEPETGLTTAVRLTKTNGSENSNANVGADLVTTDHTIADAQDVELLGDSACATGDMLDSLADKKWMPLVKPWPTKPAVEGGFTIDDYSYDAAAHTLICPNGVTRKVSPQGRASFKAACRGSPLRAGCTTSATGRLVLLGEHHQLQREHRHRASDPAWQQTYRTWV